MTTNCFIINGIILTNINSQRLNLWVFVSLALASMAAPLELFGLHGRSQSSCDISLDYGPVGSRSWNLRGSITTSWSSLVFESFLSQAERCGWACYLAAWWIILHRDANQSRHLRNGVIPFGRFSARSNLQKAFNTHFPPTLCQSLI